MSRMKKKLLLSALTLTALWLGNVAWAEARLSKIDVLFDRINIAINGQSAQLSKDSIIYNGSIYVPLRNLSEMLGAEVSWNNDTRSVNLDFINDKSGLLFSASQKGMYQYIAIQNNQIVSDMIRMFQNNDIDGLKQIVTRYDELKHIADGLKDSNMALVFDKLKASVELIRSGWESKHMDDYYIAWNIYSTNSEQLNAMLKSHLSDNK